MKTLTELKTEAFGMLTSMDPNQTPSIEDLAIFGVYVGPLLAQLSADGIVTIGDENEIPDEYFLPLARLLANMVGPRYGSPMNDGAKRADEQALLRMTSGRPTYETLSVDYF